MGYYLLDNENPFASIKDNGKKGNYYPRRSRDIQGIVIHTADVSVEEESTARETPLVFALPWQEPGKPPSARPSSHIPLA